MNVQPLSGTLCNHLCSFLRFDLLINHGPNLSLTDERVHSFAFKTICPLFVLDHMPLFSLISAKDKS